MKSFLITTVACIILIAAKAQEPIAPGVEEKITKINILYPSVEQEFKISPETSWGYRAGFNTFFEYSSSQVLEYNPGASGDYSANINVYTEHTRYFEFSPTVEIYYKWYYRLLKRQAKRKKTINNSSGYFFTGARIITPGIKVQAVNENGLDELISGIHAGWGFRRTIGKKITLDLNLKYEVLMKNVGKFDFCNISPGFILGYRINR